MSGRIAPFPAIQAVGAEAPERTFPGGHRMAVVGGAETVRSQDAKLVKQTLQAEACFSKIG